MNNTKEGNKDRISIHFFTHQNEEKETIYQRLERKGLPPETFTVNGHYCNDMDNYLARSQGRKCNCTCLD